ncbi:MAG: hypothetical protein ACTSV2_02515 [Candidatus Thorarchaeota archaeon]
MITGSYVSIGITQIEYISIELVFLGLTVALILLYLLYELVDSNERKIPIDYSAYKWLDEYDERPTVQLSDLESSENPSDKQNLSHSEEGKLTAIDTQMTRAFSPSDVEIPFGKFGEGWLVPLEKSPFHFKLIIAGTHSLSERSRFDESADYIYKETLFEFPRKGYYLVSSKINKDNGIFKGEIRGLARIKPTLKKVGIIIKIIGSTQSEGCVVTITAACRDKSILPKIIEGFEQGLWQ